MEATNSIDLKRVHAKKILEYLRRHGEGTKRQIADGVGLSFATVSSICNTLKELGYTVETEATGGKTLGRIPTPVSMADDGVLTVCFNLTTAHMLGVAVVDARHTFLFEGSYDCPDQTSAGRVVDRCAEIYEAEVLSRFPAERIIGVGVAVPGIFETDTRRIVSSEIPIFNDQPLLELFRGRLGTPVYIDNESNLCAAAKRDRGTDGGDIVYVFADAGLGVGVITRGLLVKGTKGYAPEICHMPIGDPALQCRLCGEYGCAESDLQAEGYLRKYALRGGGAPADFSAFLAALRDGDPTAEAVLSDNTAVLGRLLSILNNMFNPSVIYLGGMTSGLYEGRAAALYDAVERRAIAREKTVPRIEIDCDCDRTMLCGAAEMVLAQWVPEL